MTDDASRSPKDTPETLWRRRIAAIGDDEGYFERLGRNHAALLSDRGPVLLVTFEAQGAIRSRTEDELPLGYSVARDAGHSSLTLICERDTWFREASVYAYFDRLIDEGFFEDFDRVVFYGTGPCGYAAAAFSVAAPGATVIAVQPQATLTPRLAGWDDRFLEMRGSDFTTRYGYAPDMLDGAAKAYVIYDPFERLDAMHAALLARQATTLLPCPAFGTAIEQSLIETRALPAILRSACSDEFTPQKFRTLTRARRKYVPYLRNLCRKLEASERPALEAMVCQHVIAHRAHAPWFVTRLERLQNLLSKGGATPKGPAVSDTPASTEQPGPFEPESFEALTETTGADLSASERTPRRA